MFPQLFVSAVERLHWSPTITFIDPIRVKENSGDLAKIVKSDQIKDFPIFTNFYASGVFISESV